MGFAGFQCTIACDSVDTFNLLIQGSEIVSTSVKVFERYGVSSLQRSLNVSSDEQKRRILSCS